MAQSPDEAVAETIVSALRSGQLLNDDQLKGFAKRISTGSLRPQDWRSLAEPNVRGEGEDAATD